VKHKEKLNAIKPTEDFSTLHKLKRKMQIVRGCLQEIDGQKSGNRVITNILM
jgi:hypothetical protein